MFGAKPFPTNQNPKYECFDCALQIFHFFASSAYSPFNMSLIMFKVKDLSAPAVLRDSYETTQCKNFYVPQANQNYLQQSISCKIVFIWNHVIQYVTIDCSFLSFKYALCEHVLSIWYQWIVCIIMGRWGYSQNPGVLVARVTLKSVLCLLMPWHHSVYGDDKYWVLSNKVQWQW